MSKCISKNYGFLFDEEQRSSVFYVATPETPLSWVLVNLSIRVRDLAGAGTSQVQHIFIVDLLHTSHLFSF